MCMCVHIHMSEPKAASDCCHHFGRAALHDTGTMSVQTVTMMTDISDATFSCSSERSRCVEVGTVSLHRLLGDCGLGVGVCDSKDEAERILRHLGRASSQRLFRDLRSDCRLLGLALHRSFHGLLASGRFVLYVLD